MIVEFECSLLPPVCKIYRSASRVVTEHLELSQSICQHYALKISRNFCKGEHQCYRQRGKYRTYMNEKLLLA